MLLASNVQIHRHPVVSQVTIKGPEKKKRQNNRKNTAEKRKTSSASVAYHF